MHQICKRVYLFGSGKVINQGELDDLLGTGETHFVVRQLDAAGLAAVTAAVQAAGGEVVRHGREREHLFALFRRLSRP
jgi:hypothetical protein